MAYVPNIRITQPNIYSFVFEESNFMSSVAAGSITTLTLTVTSSDGTTINDVVVNLVTAGMADYSNLATITNVMLGLDSEVAIPDDKYTFIYTYDFTGMEPGTGHLDFVYTLVGNIEKYFYEQFVNISEQFFEGNPLRSQYVNELIASYGLLKGLKIASVRGYETEYDKIYEALGRLTIFDDYTF